MNLNKTLAALAVAMLAGLAAPMATANHTNECAAADDLSTSLPSFDEWTDAGVPSVPASSHVRFDTTLDDASGTIQKALSYSAENLGLTLTVYQKRGTDCILVFEVAVPEGGGSASGDVSTPMTNLADVPSPVADEEFFVILSNPTLDAIKYRLYREA